MLFRIKDKIFSDCNIRRIEAGPIQMMNGDIKELHHVIRIYYMDDKIDDIDFGTIPQAETNRDYEFSQLGK